MALDTHVVAKLGKAEWDRIAASRQFKDLLSLKKMFIIPALVFFFAYYFALPILVGYAPKLMSTRLLGTVTVGYVFALSQFVMGWLIAWLYLKSRGEIRRPTPLRETFYNQDYATSRRTGRWTSFH